MPKGLPFSVDTWSPSSKRKRYHFLTHAHKDHCSHISLHSSFPIYTTQLTKSLIIQHIPQLHPSLFVEIEVGQSVVIHDPDCPFSVTAFDANHCPGTPLLSSFLFFSLSGSLLICFLKISCFFFLFRIGDLFICSSWFVYIVWFGIDCWSQGIVWYSVVIYKAHISYLVVCSVLDFLMIFVLSLFYLWTLHFFKVGNFKRRKSESLSIQYAQAWTVVFILSFQGLCVSIFLFCPLEI